MVIEGKHSSCQVSVYKTHCFKLCLDLDSFLFPYRYLMVSLILQLNFVLSSHLMTTNQTLADTHVGMISESSF